MYRILNYTKIKSRTRSPHTQKKSAYFTHPDFSAAKIEKKCANYARKYGSYEHLTFILFREGREKGERRTWVKLLTLMANTGGALQCRVYFQIIDMIYLLTVIGLSPVGSSTVHIYTQTPGGSSTVHIYTQTTQRTIQNKQYIEQHNNFGRVRAVPRLG
jgi:hypothetical protein